MPEELVTSALRRALLARQPAPGLLVHSDRGGQYCGKAYRQLLHHHQALRSQSRRGECLDNAQAESLWSRLKTEELEQRDWPVFRTLAVLTLRTVAFCGISTGVFGFPAEAAAGIALAAVADWLATHLAALDLVVFNVFSDRDLALYTNALTTWS